MASMSGSGSLGSDGEGDDIGLPNNQEKKGKRTQAERQKEYRKRTKQSEEEVRRKLEDATQKLEDATHELRAMREVYEQMREQNETALARQRELQGELEALSSSETGQSVRGMMHVANAHRWRRRWIAC